MLRKTERTEYYALTTDRLPRSSKHVHQNARAARKSEPTRRCELEPLEPRMLYSGIPFGATVQDTSEYMIGDVAVSVVLLESDGTTDASTENWSATEINQVKSEITEGLQWWQDVFDLQDSSHDLNFTIDFTYADSPVQTSYEAINRNRTDETLWINDFLDHVDYNTNGSIFLDLDQWNHDQRIAHGTDWAYTMFVVDSSADVDGKFADEFFSYAYIGGPFMVTTYDNGGWDIGDMSKIVAHETGHIFYALDEHPGSGGTYDSASGYYNTQNVNAADNHPSPSNRVPSIMAEASLLNTAYSSYTSSPSSLEMLGWKDTDGNGIFDVLDVPLTLTGSGTFTQSTGTYSFLGHSDVQVLNNHNPYGTGHDVTTNSVDRIQYRIDDGSWIDGNGYGGHRVDVSQDVLVTGTGSHTIDFRTIVTETGLTSNVWSDTVTIVPGITVTPTSGLQTSESRDTATFNVVLDTQPTADVTLSIASDDTTEGTIELSNLVFTSSNWNVAQIVTVTGVDDAFDDGDIAFNIVTGAATSADTDYHGINAQDISVTNVDDELVSIDFSQLTIGSYVPGQYVSGTADVVDAGATLHLTGNIWTQIALSYNVTADTVLEFDFRSTSEGEVHAIGFDNQTAATTHAQMFKIYGTQTWGEEAFNDYASSAPGWTHHSINVGQFYTGQMEYLAFINDHDVSSPTAESEFSNITIREASVAGISLTPTSGLVTTEAGGTASFDVELDTQPTADVSITIASSDTTEGTVNVSSLTFTSSNWNVPQTVTVTGVNDLIDDGDVSYTIVTGTTSSSDSAYDTLNVIDVAVSNTDNDTAGITVTPTDNLVTTEAGGTATFDVVLDAQPTADVTIAIASNNSREGTTDVSSLTFTSSNWNVAQSVTVTGVNDAVDDGRVFYTIVLNGVNSSDDAYHGASASDVSVSNADDDTAGITVTPTSGLVTTETGDTVTFDVVLDTQPTADVTIAIASNDATEGMTNVSSLTFTSSNWNVAQAVTVTGVNDSVDDGDVSYTIVTDAATSNDGVYDGLDVSNVQMTNLDDDVAETPGITVTPTSNLTTTEAGGTATFDVVLDTQPTADVTIAISSNDATEGTTNVSSLTFTSSNWNVAQTVTVTGVNDSVDDGDVSYTIVTDAATSNGVYHGLNASDLSVSNTDNDTADITVTPTSSLVTTETGGTATFDVLLNTQPTADVTIAIASNDATEGTTNVSSLTFTSSNWNVAQTVTVTGVNDSVDDGDVSYTIVTGAATSSDGVYNGMNASDVQAINVDDDVTETPGITVTPTGDMVTTETGGTATFEVKLNTQPTSDVTIAVTSNDNTEGQTDVSNLLFTTDNWSLAQTVLITGVDDSERDRNVAYTIALEPAISSDVAYHLLDADDVSVVNTDNEKGNGGKNTGGGDGGGGNGNGGGKGGGKKTTESTDSTLATSPEYSASTATWLDQQSIGSTDTTSTASTGAQLIDSTSEYVLQDSVSSDGSVESDDSTDSGDVSQPWDTLSEGYSLESSSDEGNVQISV